MPVVYGVGVLMAVAQSLQSPSREALVPRTVRHAELPAAVALSSVGAQVGMLAGPALGGVLLAYGGPAVGLRRHAGRLRGRDRAVHAAAPATGRLEDAVGGEGRCGRSTTASSTRCARPDLLGTYVVDMVAIFLAMPVVLFPALATEGVNGRRC